MQFNIIKDKGNMHIQVMKKITAMNQQNHDLQQEYDLIYPINDENNNQKITELSNTNTINEMIEQQENRTNYVLLATKNQSFDIYNLNKSQSILKFHVQDPKRSKFTYENNKLIILLDSQSQIKVSKGEFDTDELNRIQNDEQTKNYFNLVIIQLNSSEEQPANFLPTHFACSNNIFAVYQKLKGSQFKLHILKYNDTNNQIPHYYQILISRRCKTLAIDNNDVVLISKGKKESYWFQRFSDTAAGADKQQSASPMMSLNQPTISPDEYIIKERIIPSTISNQTNDLTTANKNPLSIKSQTQTDVQVQEEQFKKLTKLYNIQLSKDQQFIQISKLEYQFRTLLLGQNSLLCGRFDTYLLMQKKKNPQNCIFHSQFIKFNSTEKIACSISDNGYTAVSVEPMQMGINVYLNYQYYKMLQSSSNGKIFKEKFNDVAIVNDRIVGLVNKKIIDFGNICSIIAEFNVSYEEQAEQIQIQSFVLNKEMNQMIIQRKVDGQDQLIYCSCIDKIEVKIANIVKQDQTLLIKQTPIIEQQESKDETVQASPQQAIKEFSYENKILQFARTDESRLNVYWREDTGQLMCGILSLDSVL